MFPLRPDRAANASSRGQRAAILEGQLHELTGFLIAVDCGAATCRGERACAVADLAGMVGKHRTVSDVLHRMRCAECGAVVASAWLQAGSVLNQRVRPRRVALIGPEGTGVTK